MHSAALYKFRYIAYLRDGSSMQTFVNTNAPLLLNLSTGFQVIFKICLSTCN